MSDRLVELDGEISVLEGARDKLKDSSDEKALRVFVDIMKQLRLLRQERNVLVKTKRAHAKRDPVKRLRALAKVQWDHGSATAASKLEAAANAHEIVLEHAKAETLREEMANVSTDDMITAVLAVVADEVELSTGDAGRIYEALLARDDAEDFVDAENLVRLRA